MNFFKKLKKENNINLNNNQKKALKHFENPALTLAIPGSGKTTLLICRLLYLNKKKNINLENILTLTFSKASAKDMENKFNSFFPNVSKKPTFSTIHKFAYKVVKKYYYYRDVNFTLIEGKKGYIKINLLRNIYKQVNKKYLSNENLETLINDISYTRNMMLKDDFPKNIKRFEKIYEKYKLAKRKNKYIDFDDMIFIALKVLQKHKKLLKKYHNKYKFLQVDEAQDTSILQHKLIELLAYKNNLFMVADDDQSIYSFRGACPKYLLDFKKHFNDSKIYYLNKNYRSSYEIVNTFSNFIQSNKSRYEKKFKNDNPKKNNLKIIEFKNDFNRNKYLLNYLSNVDQEVAILYRNNLSSLPIVNLLNKNHIPYSIKGKNMDIFNHWIFKDIKAFFNLILINQDLNSFERIYYKLDKYISKKMIQYLKNNIRNRSVFDCLINNPSIKKFQANSFRELKKTFISLKEKSPLEIINVIKYELNYLNHLKNRADNSNSTYNNLKNKLHILELIANEEESAYEFLDCLDKLKTSIYKSDNNINNNIKLTTMHSSKGLEFENVFIIDLYDSIMPQNKQDIPKDRRLLYVAISRAKSSVSILYSKFLSGKFNNDIKFINELKSQKYIEYKKYRKKDDFDFEKGELINHKKFGFGKIVDITKKNISIKFEDSIKVLSKEFCINKNLLSK